MTTHRNPDGWGRKPHRWRGRWRAYLTTGYAPNGEAIRRYVYGTTQEECADRLDQTRRELRAGVTTTNTTSLGAYLDTWLEQKALEVKPRTLEIYAAELEHVRKHLGRKKLSQLKPVDIQAMMRAILGTKVTFDNGQSNEGKGRRTVTLTARAANEAKAVLGNALDDAVALGILAFNPTKPVKTLKHQAAELQVWTAEEITRFTTNTLIEGAAYHALYYLALTAGLRPGELIALEWGDLRRDRLHVSRTAATSGSERAVGTTKTSAGTRTLTLPSDTLATLLTHRAALSRDGLESSLIFPTATGRMVSHSNLLRSLRAWSDTAKVPRIRLHDLRHTYASMAISAGVNASELARQLGHKDAAFTLRTYVHFFERATPRQAPTLAELMGAEDRKGVLSGGTGPQVLPN